MLCPDHHRLIDQESYIYTSEWLKNAKTNHEKLVSQTISASNIELAQTRVNSFTFQAALQGWRDNDGNGDEEFWQNFFKDSPKIISMAMPKHIIKIGEKCYLGGKNITNHGGNLIDFLYASPSNRNVVLVEIKTPLTNLIGKQYRNNAYSLTEELTGAVVQVLNYKDALLKNYYSLSNNDDIDFTAFNPQCLVIAGNLERENLNPTQQKSFELYRSSSNVHIITYDELFGKVNDIVELLEDE